MGVVPTLQLPSPSTTTKLTTWCQATAYKEIPVPVPPWVRAGQAWRLLLSTQPASGSTTIDLGDGAVGRVLFPVLSMPITSGPRGGKGKQEQVERVYQLRVPARAGEEVPGLTVALGLRITEQTPLDLDKKVWDSGVGLISWLVELHASSGGDADGVEGRVVFSRAQEYLRTRRWNGHRRPLAGCPPVKHKPKPSLRKRVDAIVMADVTYNTASFPSLVRTLSALTHLGPKPPFVLLGYKERDPAERTLGDLARAAVAGLEFAKVGERRGAGGAPVEVWLGQIMSP